MNGRVPMIDPGVDLSRAAFVHPTACVYGNVELGEGASLWPYVSIRSEAGATVIGAKTNIQDFVMIHGGRVKIGAYCSITHHCTIHLCEISDNCLIGINTTIMDGAVIGDNCIVAGGSFVKEGTVIPANSIVMGAPATVRKVRNSYVANRMNAWMYYRNALAYARGEYREWDSAAFRAEMAGVQAAFERELAERYGVERDA
ncbi:MAG: gamma carbonic anhydrase family protein [Pseudomonadales bacterium]|nr:gamma carbonic anhydrase family protein [Pseudomonadales bacterium]